MEYSFVIASLRKLEEDAKSLRLEVEKMAQQASAPEDSAAESADRAGGNSRFKVTPPSDIRDPLAKSISDLITPKQLALLRNLGREKGVDYEAECQRVFRCKPDELSKRAASSLIDHLTALEPEFTARRAG